MDIYGRIRMELLRALRGDISAALQRLRQDVFAPVFLADGSLEKFTSKRWQGIYISAYRDEKADEIFFAGCSGD